MVGVLSEGSKAVINNEDEYRVCIDNFDISAGTQPLSDRYLTIQIPPIRPIVFFPRSGNEISNRYIKIYF